MSPFLASAASKCDPQVSDLLASLTLEEKCLLLSGKNMWETEEIPRLGIRSLKMTDGPAGVRGSRWTDGTHTTQIPCGISLAATFDPDMVTRVGAILGAETKAKKAHVLLAPTMNISRSPFGGRNFENFGEDPFLTGAMASAYIRGVQREGVGACMKHYVANDQETRRFNMDENIDERTLREIYLKPFHMSLAAEPWTAMAAYPKINGEHADTSKFLIRDILRHEWGFDKLVMSDWGGLNDTRGSIVATTDLEMPGPPLRYGNALRLSVQAGHVSEDKHIDPSVRRLLNLLKAAGLLEKARQDDGGMSSGLATNGTTACDEHRHEQTGDVEGEVDDNETRNTVREAAGQGVVLLKNNGLLPLRFDGVRKLAIIGPNAKHPTTGGTGSAVVNPYYTTTPFESIASAALARNPKMEIVHERGIFTHLQPPLVGDCMTNGDDGSPGFRVDFYRDEILAGDIIFTTHWRNSLVYFMSDGDVPECLQGTRYGYKASGLLRPSVTGLYEFSLSNTGKAKLYIDDRLLIDNSDWTQISGNFMNCGSVEKFASLELDAGTTYRIRVDNVVTPPPTPPHDNTLFHKISGVRVGMLYKHDAAAMWRRTVEAARAADVVVLVAGHNNDTEREGSDRTSLSLPGRTDELIEAVCAVNDRVVVVTQSACAIAMPWAEKPAAIVHAWYQGQECGNAVADILLGDVNPCGKLPVTFPRRIEDHGSHRWFPGDPETDRAKYGEGILVGYRWFDAREIQPLWAFGYGLSYTTFELEGASSAPCSGPQGEPGWSVRVTLSNTGPCDGSEVIQAYVTSSSEIHQLRRDAAPKSLAAFQKMFLPSGQQRQVELFVPQTAVAWFDVAGHGGPGSGGRWRVDAGTYACHIGMSSRDIRAVVNLIVAEERAVLPQ
ncbi:glycoside hydrolase superfamily [Plectosphaerella cucumerina]|uniref:beta-glucosidase n=1 Tax=Plectosphaerella cucumerina TaxID=40658 RepID=A0A8K0X9H5_9PEZI|nr:glycoside hydrolase superfamily [Plectosphaerella cucumerina]